METTPIPPELRNQDRGPGLIIVVWVFAFLALILVSVKIWTRLKILHQSGLEDAFIFLAWVGIGIGEVAAVELSASVHYGFGKHPVATDPKALLYGLYLYKIGISFSSLSRTLPKLSLAILLHKITAPEKFQAWLLYSVPVLHVITKAVGFAAFTDIFLAVVPAVAFWKLRLKPKVKIMLILVFSTTTIAAACTLVCVAYFPKVNSYEDFSYSGVTYTMWAVIEGDAIIITACIPGLRPFVKHFCKKNHSNHRPNPLQIDPQLKAISDVSALSTPVSPRRMQPRASGSVSHGLQPPSDEANRQRSMARAMSSPNDLEWQGLDTPDEDVEKERTLSEAGNVIRKAQVEHRVTL
ncbi:MAG: hypothetical protein Q9170_000581 [Blastenia crenularia]